MTTNPGICATANPCLNGICTSLGGNEYTCACFAGWQGTNCNLLNGKWFLLGHLTQLGLSGYNS